MADAVTTNVRVFCRFRPLNELELKSSHSVIVRVPQSKTAQIFRDGIPEKPDAAPDKEYHLDHFFDSQCEQEAVYEHFRPVIDDVLTGFNGTIFAYGQTGSG